MSVPQRGWVWLGAAAGAAATVVGLGRVAARRTDPRLAVLGAEAFATWRPRALGSDPVREDSESFAVSGHVDFVVVRRRLTFASGTDARNALAEARGMALTDGWRSCEGCGLGKPGIDADLGLYLDGPVLVITLRAFSPTRLFDLALVGSHRS